jgi:threonine dehydratase
VRAARERLGARVATTPVRRWTGVAVERELPGGEIWLKEELFQVTGSFKPRGALTVMLALDSEALGRGVTAVSAGNHAIAVAYAAHSLETSAHVVMPSSASPARVALARAYGATVELVEDVHRAFARVDEIVENEGRTFVHPFEGPLTALGTATLGLELCEQLPGLDAVIIPVGGGGLCAGMAAAIAQAEPECRVYAVEPDGADTLHRSLHAGSPQRIERVDTIADSLGAPFALPYSFELCRRHVHRAVRVSDQAIRAAMRLLFESAKLAVEPAGAAATAALAGPLREELAGKRVALVVCGANTDPATYTRLLTQD